MSQTRPTSPGMRTLTVDLGVRSYPIYIGSDIFSSAGFYTQHVKASQVLIVTNETVAPLYLEQVKAALSGFKVATVVLPDGERFKNLVELNKIFDQLLSVHFDRQCTLVALGGGVVGDMTGFAAATYQRGVNFIQVPTTLLSQVDSSVGGKTGVNHPLGKNMIGAFHQPQCVIADTSTLDTLPDRELSAGLAEVIKYGLINDPDFFTWLEQNMAALRARTRESLIYAVETSCIDKAQVVAADEREAGQRALLNLGHTFGHAIENGMGYGVWLHGEAVGAGMCLAADLSVRLGWLAEEERARLVRLIEAAGLPTKSPDQVATEDFMRLMAVDKKVMDGQMRLVLMKGIGRSVVTSDFDQGALMATLHG